MFGLLLLKFAFESYNYFLLQFYHTYVEFQHYSTLFLLILRKNDNAIILFQDHPFIECSVCEQTNIDRLILLLFQAQSIQFSILKSSSLQAHILVTSLANCFLLIIRKNSLESFKLIEPGLIRIIISLSCLQKILIFIYLLYSQSLILI